MATDIVRAIRHKSGKAIFRDSSVARHLIVYPNSNASLLLFDEDDERDAINKLRAEVANDITELSQTVNGCRVHILGKHLLCFDALGEIRILMLGIEVPDVRVFDPSRLSGELADPLLEGARK